MQDSTLRKRIEVRKTMLEAIADTTQSAVDLALKIAGDTFRALGDLFRG
jgi:hypothetical protein